MSLRRIRLPYFFLTALLVTIMRYVVFMGVPEDLVGMYISIFLYDFIFVPVPILALLIWNYKTAMALKGEKKVHTSIYLHRQDSTNGNDVCLLTYPMYISPQVKHKGRHQGRVIANL